MININHPKIHGKPPLNVSTTMKDMQKKQLPEEIYDDKIQNADQDQNIVETTKCSFEQLCSMIDDLEKDITDKLPEIDQLQLEPEKDESGGKYEMSGTSFDDIMSFLTKLEEGSPDETKGNTVDSTLLEEIFNNSQPLPYVDYENIENNIPRIFEEDLATAQLQLQEKNATISLLKEQLKSERKAACEKLEGLKKSNVAKLQRQEDKYRGIVKRHQKFIEQLISEKTDLTEKCNSLAQRVKEIEIKMQRDLKAAADRHAVELQKTKDRFAAAEKIKRERWIEARTTKIKEMTVKGLEPELRNMMQQHAEEIQRLRNVHMKELQDAELRIIRRSNQQLEQLRLELTASHERMLSNEKSILWSRYQEKLEEQENQFKTQQTKLLEELQRDREKLEKEQAKRDAEREISLQKMRSQLEQEVEALKQQNSIEKATLQESLKREWETWLTDYKRQQNFRIEQAENKIKDECNRERDRQIELAIERLEKDSRNAKLTLQQSFDCKLRSLKEKFEMELQIAMENQEFHKVKLTEMSDKLEKTRIQYEETENRLYKCACELNNANEIIKQLTVEKDSAKRLARQEIEGEKRELEEKIASLYQEISRINSNKDVSMAQLHSRIKLIMTQKALMIKNLTRELNNEKLKSQGLEKLLDQQRREYILKDL